MLGKEPTIQHDAIHVAILACVAGEDLMPGDHVGLCGGMIAYKDVTPIGIVDPFLKDRVLATRPFYLCIYGPGTKR